MTNKEFGKFVRATYYETEAEKFGWSFVLSSFLPNAEQLESAEVDPEAVSEMSLSASRCDCCMMCAQVASLTNLELSGP